MAETEEEDMARALRILAFDLGAESGRAVVGSLAKGRITLDVAHRFANVPVETVSALHWDALGLFREMKVGLARAVEKGGRGLASLGCDTWGVDFALLAEDGELLGSPVHYRDSRTDGMMEAAFELVPRGEIYRATGIQFMQINTVYQLLAMASASSSRLRTAKRLLMMAGLFHYFFTGEGVAEFSLATTSQMYDPTRGDWARGVLDRLGIPTDFLPPVAPSGTLVGGLRASVARETGASAGLRVIAPACHDTGSAVAAVPASGEDWLYLSSGTWSLMGAETREPNLTDKALEYNFTNEGGVGGSFRLLRNIMGLWLVQQCRRSWEREGAGPDYAEMTRMASRAEPFRAFVDPDDPSFLNPPDMPQAIADFCARTGQERPEGREAILRCALESLALRYRDVKEKLAELLGREPRVIHVVGGGSRNGLLNRFTADACGIPVAAGPAEATAIGNILMQAVALGELGGLDDLRQVARDSFEVKVCEPGARDEWDQAFARFKALGFT